MTLTLFDVYRFFDIINLYDGQKPASRIYVQRIFNNQPVKHARFPNYNEIEEFCQKLNLIKIESNVVSITDLGKILFEYNRTGTQDDLQDFFINDIIYDSEIGKQIGYAFSKFYPMDQHNMCYPKQKIHQIFECPEILPILYELNLLKKDNDMITINLKHLQMITQSRRKITQKQLEAQLENQKIIGSIAEEIVLAFENDRLVKEGHLEESIKVKQISTEFVNAGYDIESFSEDKNGKIQQIYIEVKGSTRKELDFHWSVNEIEKAKEYKEQYLIYFVSEIDIKTGKSIKDPIIISNPYETVFKNSSFTVKAQQYHVTQNHK